MKTLVRRTALVSGVIVMMSSVMMVFGAGVAFAATSITTPSSNPFVVPSDGSGHPTAFTVVATGFNVGDQVFVEQCDGTPTSAQGWSPSANCDLGTSPAAAVADGSGTATFSAGDLNRAFTPSKGASPQGLFNCLSANDPSPGNGLTDFRNCQIRVSTNDTAATSDQVFRTIQLPDSVPAAPTIGTVTPGNGSGSVAFTPGAANGSAITSFAASCTSSDGGVSGSNSGAGTPVVVSGLTNGRTYTCTVTATNSFGTSPASAASASFVPATVPGAPTSVSATPGSAKATVSWKAPASNGGSAITGYTVTASIGTKLAKTVNVGVVTKSTVTGLTNGKPYTFKVAAKNSRGTGAKGSATPIVVGAPAAPTAVTATASTGGKATLKWKAPTVINAGPVTGYVVTPFKAGVAQKALTFSKAITQKISGLAKAKSYTFKVAATNKVGTGPQSAASKAITAK